MITDRERADAKYIKQFQQLDNKELCRIRELINKISAIRYKKKVIQTFKQNDQVYTGKTYRRAKISPWGLKKEILYYKIISAYGENEYRVTCLVFPESPEYKYNEQLNKFYGFTGEGYWKLNTFYLDSIMISSIDEERGFEEITNEEWKTAFNKHINTLKELEAKI